MTYNYSYNDTSVPPNVSNLTTLPPNVLRNPPLPPVGGGPQTPTINVPVGQVASSGTGSFWDALRSLFSGQRGPAQGMTAMLNPRGQAGPSTDALGNPFNRF